MVSKNKGIAWKIVYASILSPLTFCTVLNGLNTLKTLRLCVERELVVKVTSPVSGGM